MNNSRAARSLVATGRTIPPPPPLTLNEIIDQSHSTAVEHGWWSDPEGQPLPVNVGEKLMLIVTELAEAMEEWRNGRDLTEAYHRDDGKPEGFPSELADVVIRIADLCGRTGIDLDAAVREKMTYNESRSFRHGGKRA